MAHRISRLCCLALTLTSVSGCVSPTPYAPAQSETGYGYVDTPIETGKYRIVFRGNSQTSRERVEDFVCYRAAEVTVLDGYDYFVVLEGDVEALSDFQTVGTSFGGPGIGGFSRSRHRGFYSGFYGGFHGGYLSTTSQTRERRRYWAGAIIETGNGPKPDLPNAYDARDVLDSLGPRIIDF